MNLKIVQNSPNFSKVFFADHVYYYSSNKSDIHEKGGAQSQPILTNQYQRRELPSSSYSYIFHIFLQKGIVFYHIAATRALIAIQMRSDICKKKRGEGKAHLCASYKKDHGRMLRCTFRCTLHTYLRPSQKKAPHCTFCGIYIQLFVQAPFMSTRHTGRVGLSTNYQGIIQNLSCSRGWHTLIIISAIQE